MTSALEQRAASLFSVGFAGKTPSEELRDLLRRGVGGVILFARNVGSPEEVLELNRAIKREAGRPLLLSVDQEGGRVARLRRGFSELPAMRTLGATGSSRLARELGGLAARELRAVGFDLTYAPVLDVDTNPQNPVIGDRSFGSSAELVSELGAAFVTGLQQAGVAACAKHFPGHGDTEQDSHLELPRLRHELDRLERVELPPFRAAADAGVAAIMTAHVIFEAVDAAEPATMSRAVVDGILRGSLGYTGLVISDDLEMRAIADHYAIEDAVLRGLRAGVDHFLICHSASRAQRAIDAVLRAVESRELDRAVIEAAALRFDQLRSQFAQTVGPSSGLSVLRSPEHLQLLERVLAAAGATSSSEALDPTERARLARG
jgi:beta-N-acetylhexosaminidase